jgi:small-conductance mechanosensitive channel
MAARRSPRFALAPVLVLAPVLAAAPPAPFAAAQAELLGGAAPSPEAPETPIAVEADGPADAEIERRLGAIFAAVESLGDVRPSVRSGVVVLGGSAPDPAAAAEAERIAGRVEGVVTVVDRIDRAASAGESLAPGVERLRSRLRDLARALPSIAAGLALFALFSLAGALLARRRALFVRLAPNAFLAELAAQAVRLICVAAGAVVALEFMGATALLGAILGAAGILGLALGFAVRDTIENYVASVLLSLRRPFAPNDYVDVAGREGFVVRLTSRATVLLTPEGNHVRIPNALVFKSVILNYTHAPERRFEFALGVNADADLEAALELGARTLAALGFTLAKPVPGGWIEAVGDSSVILRFVAWIDQTGVDFLQARSEGIRLVKLALEEGGFELPEPIYRLRMEQGAAAGRSDAAAPAGPGAARDVARRGALEEKAAAERRGRGDDLLDADAPQE